MRPPGERLPGGSAGGAGGLGAPGGGRAPVWGPANWS
ncbi:hypothetical protein STIAU_4690, partial [Stigmatella aurantiaca DW4/3-1]